MYICIHEEKMTFIQDVDANPIKLATHHALQLDNCEFEKQVVEV